MYYVFSVTRDLKHMKWPSRSLRVIGNSKLIAFKCEMSMNSWTQVQRAIDRWCSLLLLWRRGVVVSVVRRSAGPVSTGMGDRLWAGTPSRYITRQLAQLSLASLRGRWIEYQLRLGKGWNVTSVGWQVTPCDPICHGSSSSGVATLSPNCYMHVTLLILLLLYFTARAMLALQALY